MDFHAFADELTKIAATPQERAAQHFAQPDWKVFEKSLRSGPFRNEVLKSAEADEKLKKYVKTFGAYQGSKDVIAEIKSGSSGKVYKVKDLHNGRWGCGCRDWQFKHSIHGGDCKHIRSVKQSRLVKESGVSPFQIMGVGATMTGKVQKDWQQGKKAKTNVRNLKAGLPWQA